MSAPEKISAQKCFGGWLNRYAHDSDALGCDMVFGVYLPPAAAAGPVPALWWLSGVTTSAPALDFT
jgi:S-formylglutathione hydrolase